VAVDVDLPFGLGGGDSLGDSDGPLACVARLISCKVFLDHPQKKVWVSWRGSQPSPVGFSKNKNLTKENLC
jgi:hypothetical protein